MMTTFLTLTMMIVDGSDDLSQVPVKSPQIDLASMISGHQ
jgi:hypothetical protein